MALRINSNIANNLTARVNESARQLETSERLSEGLRAGQWIPAPF